MSLTFEERHHIRQLVSRARKEIINAQNKRFKPDSCASCSTPRDEFNLDCETCRRRRLRLAEKPLLNCNKCGKGLMRDTMRRRRRHNSPIADMPICYPCSRDHCAGCGEPSDQRTRGCETCKSRHLRRRWAAYDRA